MRWVGRGVRHDSAKVATGVRSPHPPPNSFALVVQNQSKYRKSKHNGFNDLAVLNFLNITVNNHK